jgi:hypothetical protein
LFTPLLNLHHATSLMLMLIVSRVCAGLPIC